jgi:hypothetical protein
VAFDDVAKLELARDASSVAVFQILRPARLEPDKVGARVFVHAVPDALAYVLDVVLRDDFWVRHQLRDVHRDADFVYA